MFGVKGETAAPRSQIPVLNLWHMLVYAWELVEIGDNFLGDAVESPSLAALIATLLSDLVERRLHRGLKRSYRAAEGELAYVRGRLHVAETKARLALDRGRVYCGFEAYDINIPLNGVIRSTLRFLAGPAGLQPAEDRRGDTRARLAALDRRMDGIAPVQGTREVFRRLQFGRDDPLDRLMIALCEFVAEGLMPSEGAGGRSSRILAQNEKILWAVYERFVQRFYGYHLPDRGWRVRCQPTFQWPTGESSIGMSTMLPAMLPDVVLDHADLHRRIIIDTKFTSVLASKEDRELFKSGHLYQMFAYLGSPQAQKGDFDLEGVLLYPSVGVAVDEFMRLPASRLRLKTVDLMSDWQSIERHLLAIQADARLPLA